MDHNETPINIYSDLSKTFDTLDHDIFLAKLQYYGMHGTPLQLVKVIKYMLFKTSKKKVQTLLLQMDNTIIDKVLDFIFLGIHFNEQLN